MKKELLEKLEKRLAKVVDDVLAKKLTPAIGPIVSQQVKKIVQQLRAERALFGKDRTGLDDDQKQEFVEIVKAVVGLRTKANEALISQQDNRGGYLVPTETARAILRIAASVGVVLSQAQKWPMESDELRIPNYTGSILEGDYLGVDAAGSVTGLNFGSANLIAKQWQLAFVVGNDLLADAGVDLADWLMGLAGEALANRADKEGLVGGGTPFDGILNHSGVTVLTLGSGDTDFEDYSPIEDSADAIASVEESVLDGAAFYMSRTVWAKIRIKKDTAGNYLLNEAGKASPATLAQNPTGGGVIPAGEMMGFPVFTNRNLPANSASAVNTKYMIFGNLKLLAFGSKGDMTIEQYRSGSFGGKEIALANQRGLVYRQRHALTVALPAGFVVVKTAAS